MELNLLKLLNCTTTTGKVPFMKPVLYIIGERICFFSLETAQAMFLVVPLILQMSYGLIYYPIMDLFWWIEFFWLLLMYPNHSLTLFARKRGICGRQSRK